MPELITGIDHLVIRAPDFGAAVSDYAQLLGSEASPASDSGHGRAAAFRTDNLAIVIQEHSGEPGLTGLCLAVSDLARLQRRLKRLGMHLLENASNDPMASAEDAPRAPAVHWLSAKDGRGLNIGFIERPHTTNAGQAERITGLDHLVIATGNAEATAFLLGARLGLDLRMDLSNPAWDARLLFFRCGDLILEVFQVLEPGQPAPTIKQPTAEEDVFYGLSWRTADTKKTNASLAGLGFKVSEVRDGRKPGTQVFTVRDRTAGVATLVLGKSPS